MKKRLIAFLLSIGLMMTTAVSVRAAEVDITPSATQLDGSAVSADDTAADSEAEASSPLPTAYSSLELGYTTPIRSQNYNTCWAYCSTAVMEVLLNRLTLGIGHLSPMDMNFRMVKQEDGSGWQRGYTDAGYPYIALGYLTAFGAVSEADVPQSTTQEEFALLRDDVVPYAYADAVIYLAGDDIDAVKNAVYTYGAAVGNFHYDGEILNGSTSAYFCDTDDIPTAKLYGHAIAIVGWDDDYDVENFSEAHRPERNGAWLCKNSWGDSWASMGGYFWISYEDRHLFDSRFGPSYAIAGITLSDDGLKIKQNEMYGATYEFNYPELVEDSRLSLTYANVFDFIDGFNVIDKITFESTADGSEYEVFYIPTDENGIPVADEDSWVLLGADTIPYEGYICADIKDYVAPIGAGAVGIRIRRTDSTGSISIGVDEWLTTASRSIFVPDSKSGDSYLLGFNETPYDLMDFYREQMEDEIGGTFVIKAQTRRGTLGDVDGDGEVMILDATHIQRYLAGIIDFDHVQETVADYDRDGEITILDCTRIQRMLAGIND